MSVPQSPQQAEWQPTPRMPKLSYRKAIPQDELDKITYSPREPITQPKPPVRTASVRDTAANPTAPNLVSTSSKKKNSFLSGFFSKEPTISALAQVEADLTAKHGAASPNSVPHVSSRKMPEYVPKVNSKWDGIPETVKNREREERQRKRLSQRGIGSSHQQTLRSQSSDGSIHATMDTQRSGSRGDSDAASRADSWQSRNERTAVLRKPGSISSATSSNDSRDRIISHSASAKSQAQSQSLRSPSGSSLPEITSFFPHHHRHTTDRPSEKANGGSSIDVIPEHSSSPIPTPREMSPVTPVYSAGRETSPRMMAADADSIGANTSVPSTKRTHHVPIDAFLAGEARPLELKEDSNAPARKPVLVSHRSKGGETVESSASVASKLHSKRGRPGVKANAVVRSEAAPWETQMPSMSGSASKASKPRAPKSLIKSK